MTNQFQTGPRERHSIDLRNDTEVEFWCRKLQCSEVELRRAVADVGEAPLTVAEHLGLTEAALA